jgi:hypothetical protein
MKRLTELAPGLPYKPECVLEALPGCPRKPAAEVLAVGVDQRMELLRVCFLQQTKARVGKLWLRHGFEPSNLSPVVNRRATL